MSERSSPTTAGQTISVKGVLFDMDGVLLSSTGSVQRCWRQWATHYGVFGAETLEIPHGMRAVEIIEHLKPGLDVPEALRYIEDIEIKDVGGLQVLPGVQALLGSLPPDRWTIVTSATERLLRARLATVGLPVPERLISAETVIRGKPDPEPYRRGAEILGLPANDCLVVEDAPSGVRAGVQAGCPVLGVEGTYRAAALWEAGAQVVVPSLAQVSMARVGGEMQFRVLSI